jgi:hypothetical protein
MRGGVGPGHSLVLLVLLVTAVTLVACEVPGATRGGIGLAALVLVPGGAVLTLLPVGSTAEWIGYAIPLSLCFEAVGSMLMLWFGCWSPGVLAGILGTLSALLLVRDITVTRDE